MMGDHESFSRIGKQEGAPQEEFPKSKMVVARRMPTGEIQEGKYGDTHDELLSDAELGDEDLDYGDPNKIGTFGYTNPGSGRFLTREEAFQELRKPKSRPTQ